jgi:sec-independent protein translocase protein TatB
MEILGIGPMELFFIVLLAIIILGPRDMVKAGRTVGRFMRDVTRSEYYRAFVSSSRQIRDLPTRLIREANLEEELREVDRLMRSTAGGVSTNTIGPPDPQEPSASAAEDAEERREAAESGGQSEQPADRP